MRATQARAQHEGADAVGLIVALLERFPQIATLVSHPSDGTLTLSFVVSKRLDKVVQAEVGDAILDHVRAFAAAGGETTEVVEVACEADDRMTFVRVVRDAGSLAREELQMLTGLLKERFGELLVESAPASDEAFEDDVAAQDDLVEFALESLRDPAHSRSLLGFREEKRVMVYFVSSRKKPKARAR
ncbi:MAG: hypothetical protein GIW95_12015 [Candidatus Eremiobacteraeota bacterium]|nr:hypothetical protein [Candidatus Eremiobacteraeota bacterium]